MELSEELKSGLGLILAEKSNEIDLSCMNSKFDEFPNVESRNN